MTRGRMGDRERPAPAAREPNGPHAAHPVPAEVAAALVRRPGLLYEQLHRGGPLQWNERARCWLVVGYDLARTVLRDPRFTMPRPAGDSRWATEDKLRAFMRGLLLEAEGREHDLLRQAIAPVFAPRAVRERMPAFEALLNRLLDDSAPATAMDGVAAISSPFPVEVVGDLVGIPPADRTRVSVLCRRLSQGGGLTSGQPPASAVDAAAGALAELEELVLGWLAGPGHGLDPRSVLGRLAGLRDGPGGFGDMEIVANVFSLYLAGHDTSRNLISSILLRLAADGELFGAVAAGAVDRAAVVDRLLLSEAPLTFTARVARADLDLAGHRILSGDRLQVMLGAANHEVLRDRREQGALGGVAFGEGRHVCLGAHVARAEGVALLKVLTERWSAVGLAGAPEWSPHFLHRGLAELPLEVLWKERAGPGETAGRRSTDSTGRPTNQ